MNKRIIIIAVLVVSILFVFSLFKDSIIKSAIEKGAEYVTGLRLTMSHLRVGLIRPVVEIKGLKLYNPARFQEKIMVDIPRVYVSYELGSFFRKKIHIYEIDVNLSAFDVVKNRDGDLNLNALKMSSGASGAKPAEPTAEKPGTPRQIKVDKLHLKVGVVRYTDYSSGSAIVREFMINIDETYKDIEDLTALASLIVMRSLVNTSIANLTNFDLGPLKASIGAPLEKAQSAVAGMKNMVQPMLQQTGTASGATVQKTKETIAKTTEALSGVLGAFGEKKE